MPNRRKIASRRQRRSKFFLWLPAVLAAGLFLLGGGYFTATGMENNDSFCASCHTEPETTYYQRRLAAQPVDLASWHGAQKDTRCIDCHSGPGFAGRVGALQVGAEDLVLYVTHRDRQPAPLTVPIGDANCTKCHPGVTAETDFDHHYHAFLLRWQTLDPNAASCVSCHASHPTDGDASLAYLSTQRTEQVCQQCHAAGIGE